MEKCKVSFQQVLIAVGLVLMTGQVWAESLSMEKQAQELAREALITDTHIDVPYRLEESWEDVSVGTESGDFDYPRAKKGGLDLPFMSIYTPSSMETAEGDASENYQLANQLIDSVEAIAARAPEKFMLVHSVQDAKDAMRSGHIGLAMGMENGSPINNDLKNVQYFADRGIRYITLAHGMSNHISDSSYE